MSAKPQAPEIRRLAKEVVNRIAAGEVIQRPASALKELIENCLDAQATEIVVTLGDGGLSYLQIMDNGHGIRLADFPILCERFTTSKLREFSDLNSITTFGFRGEALASLTHVCKVTITSMSNELGSRFAYTAHYLDSLMIPAPGATTSSPIPCAGLQGTTITAQDMFYNIPVRKAALKSPGEEYTRCLEVIQSYSLQYPHVSFACKKRNSIRVDFRSLPRSSVLDNIKLVYNTALAREVIRVRMNFPGEPDSEPTLSTASKLSASAKMALAKSEERNEIGLRVQGYVTNGNYSYTGKRSLQQVLFINHRLVECGIIKRAIDGVYASILPKNALPWAFLSIQLPAFNVDVNVHPTKKEVHFLHEERVVELITSCLQTILVGANDSRVFSTQMLLPSFNQTRTFSSQIQIPIEAHAQQHATSSYSSATMLLGQDISTQGSVVSVTRTSLDMRLDDDITHSTDPLIVTFDTNDKRTQAVSTEAHGDIHDETRNEEMENNWERYEEGNNIFDEEGEEKDTNTNYYDDVDDEMSSFPPSRNLTKTTSAGALTSRASRTSRTSRSILSSSGSTSTVSSWGVGSTQVNEPTQTHKEQEHDQHDQVRELQGSSSSARRSMSSIDITRSTFLSTSSSFNEGMGSTKRRDSALVRTDYSQPTLSRFLQPKQHEIVSKHASSFSKKQKTETLLENVEEKKRQAEINEEEEMLTVTAEGMSDVTCGIARAQTVSFSEKSSKKENVSKQMVDKTNDDSNTSISSSIHAPVISHLCLTSLPSSSPISSSVPIQTLTSIRELLHDAANAREVSLSDLFPTHTFVGCVTPQHCLVQRNTTLVLLNLPVLSRQFFYERVLTYFGHLPALRLASPLPLSRLLLAGLNSRGSGTAKLGGFGMNSGGSGIDITRHTSHQQQLLVQHGINVLREKSSMLKEYFGITILTQAQVQKTMSDTEKLYTSQEVDENVPIKTKIPVNPWKSMAKDNKIDYSHDDSSTEADYITIENDIFITEIPMLLTNYVPPLAKLPRFLASLVFTTTWDAEKACFSTLASNLADFYAFDPTGFLMTAVSKSTANSDTTAITEHMDEHSRDNEPEVRVKSEPFAETTNSSSCCSNHTHNAHVNLGEDSTTNFPLASSKEDDAHQLNVIINNSLDRNAATTLDQDHDSLSQVPVPTPLMEGPWISIVSDVLLPAMKDTGFIPRKGVETAGHVLPVTQLQDLYKVFERC